MIALFHKKFAKLTKKLSPSIRLQLQVRIDMFTRNPYDPILNNHEINHPYKGCRSINITGNIRAIYEPHPDYGFFIHIGTHSELYK